MDIFADKIVLITGGASGIGRALGRELAVRGACIILVDINEQLLMQTVIELKKEGFKVKLDVVDISAFDQVKKMVEDTFAKYGRLDYIFNNAGIGVAGEAHNFSYEDWKKVIDVNLYGAVNGVAAAYPLMVKQGFGHIINTASAAGLFPAVGEISYTASKYGIVGLSNALRIEGADLGVKVSVVCPGLIETPILKTMKAVGYNSDKLYELLPARISPEACAKEILKGVQKNKATIVITPLAKFTWYIQRFTPSIMAWFCKRAIRKLREVHKNLDA